MHPCNARSAASAATNMQIFPLIPFCPRKYRRFAHLAGEPGTLRTLPAPSIAKIVNYPEMVHRFGKIGISRIVLRYQGAPPRQDTGEIEPVQRAETTSAGRRKFEEDRAGRRGEAPGRLRRDRPRCCRNCEFLIRWSPHRTSRRGRTVARHRPAPVRYGRKVPCGPTLPRPTASISPERSIPVIRAAGRRRARATATSPVPAATSSMAAGVPAATTADHTPPPQSVHPTKAGGSAGHIWGRCCRTSRAPAFFCCSLPSHH